MVKQLAPNLAAVGIETGHALRIPLGGHVLLGMAERTANAVGGWLRVKLEMWNER